MQTLDDTHIVYWIHIKSFSDPKTQGYIGVTSKTAEERFKEHYVAAYKSRSRNKGRFTLHEMIDKYGMSGLELTIIFCGSEKECYKLERELRPLHNIGWNIARGGK